MRRILTSIILLLVSVAVFCQVTYTANDTIIPYPGFFRAGTNLGAYPGFSDEFLGELAAGNPETGVAGLDIKALRPGLFENFLYEFGYDSRLSTYELFGQLGLEDNTLIVGFPSPEHQEPNEYCSGIQSTLFSNLYTDIWDNGENGTPVNDDNHYALYIYRLATMYGEHIKFWEIWNEPGFDYTRNRGWLPPGAPGNWWENNPDPCDYKLRAPIFHYVRLLRISYDVIKHVDPNDYIVVSGVGYPSFLDAILRNTDNPLDGTIQADYPLKGGAYFDVMGFHSYPHFDGSLRYWDDTIMDFVPTRHSDAAADGILTHQDSFQNVLNTYGYDGNTFPLKPWMITEINLPRKEFDEYIGSEESQRNFMIKHLVVCMQNNFLQSHIYKLAEDETYDEAFFEFDLMGLYKKLRLQDYAFQEPNDEGIAYKSASQLLFGKVDDPERTAALNLPSNIRGGAFKDINGNYTYVLWARTSIDNSEVANATYDFPAGLGIDHLIQRNWDYGATEERISVSSENIQLTGTPIFLTEMSFSADVTAGCAPQVVQFNDLSPTNAASWNWSFEDGSPANSTAQNPSVSFTAAGSYQVSLESFDEQGNLLSSQTDIINIESTPEAEFTYTSNGPFLQFSNNSSNNSTSFLWEFGDGSSSTSPSPDHLYLEAGVYTVTLTASNYCGDDVQTISLNIEDQASSHLGYTANDEVPVNTHHFRPGTNISFYPSWTDMQLGDIAAGNVNEGQTGAGVKSLRTLLPHYFLEFWGYDVRVETFEHYNNIDLVDNVATIGFPSVNVVDTARHCANAQSILFRNMYLDIWDDGENGTPINDENEYAKYLYHTVDMYKDNVRFWEVLSGPDFDESGDYGWLPPGEQGNWWDNDPDPCNAAIHAPVQHYVRMLRISYEVIKAIDPDAYVCLSGIGFPSFVDAVLRNTDNPIDGSPVPGYEHGGGAYFDAIGYSSLPHFDGSTKYYDLGVGDFVYERNSDAAIRSISGSKVDFENVLHNYGYDGTTFPEKQWYVSACNIPRKQLEDFIGGDEAQRNFIIKAYVESVRNDLAQFHVRAIAEAVGYSEATDAFQMMGLYQKLDNIGPYNQTINDQGVAYKTTSDLLYCTSYDAAATAALNLPDSIDGGAFVDGNGKYTYVLWAKTTIDQTETASASYSFPLALNLNQLYQKNWDYSSTGINPLVNADDIQLSGAPIFLTEAELPLLPPLAMFSADTVQGCPGLEVQFFDASLRADSWLWTFEGADIMNSTDQNPIVSFPAPGLYQIRLEAINAAGSHTAIYSEYIEIWDDPVAGFTFEINAPFVQFTNASDGATNYLWDFGDNATAQNFDPQHFYFNNGSYDVQLIAFNACGTDTITQTILVGTAPQGGFAFNTEDECSPYAIQFQDQSFSSPDVWTWTFPGGTPETSNAANPVVTYNQPGTYTATMIVSNDFGSDTIIQSLILDPDLISTYEDTFCSDQSIDINGTIYSIENPTGTETIINGSVNGCDSIVMIQIYDGSSANTINPTICEGEVFEIGNLSLNEEGTYEWITENAIGCDSTVTIELEVLDTSSHSIDISFCEGEVVTIGDLTIDTTGTYEWVTENQLGCDSTLIIYAEVYEHSDLTIDPSICAGEVFEIGELILSESGTYTWSTVNHLGCDSIVTINLNVQDTFFNEITDTIFEGETYTIGSSVYDATGIYLDTLLSSNGCDSIVQLNLFVDIIDDVRTLTKDIQLSYFPNPFDQKFTVQVDLPQSAQLGIELFDTHGRNLVVLKPYGLLSTGPHAFTFDQTNLAQGVYWVRVQHEAAAEIFRIVKVD